MKGIVFVMFEDFLGQRFGAEVFDAVLDACPQVGGEPFVSPRTYPDTWLVAMLEAACAQLSLTPAQALRAFGAFAMPELARRFPNLVAGIATPRHLLATVDEIIHVEVQKLLADAVTPKLVCTEVGPADMTIRYESPRGLCAFLEGLLDGVAVWSGQPVEHTHATCKHRGDTACTFDVHFPALVPA